jgi:hypothetical protein
MAITEFQRDFCRLIAANRKKQGVSCVAGGIALNQLIRAARISRDIDIFHDTAEAVYSAWDSDKKLLSANGYSIEVTRTLSAYVEATVHKDQNTVQFHPGRTRGAFPRIVESPADPG